jgi:hypothetical protein
MPSIRWQIVQNFGCKEGVEKHPMWCSASLLSSNNSVGTGVIVLEKHWLLSNKSDWFVLPTSSGTSRKFASHILCLPSCTAVEWCPCSPRTWCACSLQQKVESWIFSFWQKWLAFQFWVIVTHPTRCLWQCCTENHYPHFCSEQVIADMFPVLLYSFWV